MISLWTSVVALSVVVFSMRLKVAGTPSTVTESTLRVAAARLPVEPWKSREYDDSGAPVVAASMVVGGVREVGRAHGVRWRSRW